MYNRTLKIITTIKFSCEKVKSHRRKFNKKWMTYYKKWLLEEFTDFGQMSVQTRQIK